MSISKATHTASLNRAIVQAATAEHRAHRMMQEQEQEARRWTERAEWARSRGEDQLAAQALRRAAEHSGRAARFAEIYQSAGARVRLVKRQLRDADAGRGPPLLTEPLEESLEGRFQALQREEQLDKELAELKARISGPATDETEGETHHGNA
jgi:phage shock protein A